MIIRVAPLIRNVMVIVQALVTVIVNVNILHHKLVIEMVNGEQVHQIKMSIIVKVIIPTIGAIPLVQVMII